MSTTRNDVFRMISLRGSDRPEAIEPLGDETNTDGPVVELLGDMTTLPELASVDVVPLERAALGSSAMAFAKDIRTRRTSASDLKFAGEAITPKSLIANKEYRNGIAAIYNLWLYRKLSGDGTKMIAPLDHALRIADWIAMLAATEKTNMIPFRQSLSARKAVVLPPALTQHAASVEPSKQQRDPARSASQRPSVEELRTANETAVAQLRDVDVVEDQLLSAILSREVPAQEQREDVIIAGKGHEGLLSRLTRVFFGRTARTTKRSRTAPADRFDDAMLASLNAKLTEPQRALFSDATSGGTPGVAFDTTFRAISAIRKSKVNAANSALTDYLVATGNVGTALPSPTQDPAPAVDGAVQWLGWGDLIVATERLVDYDAREIAHIENIMPGESKTREHTRTDTREEIFELESLEEEESEQELETTSRHELQTESEKVIEQEFSVEAGVNTSGRYGLTKVETSFDAGFSRASKEAQRSTIEVAKEIVSRAVDRTFKSVREFRRTTVTTEVVELNRHELVNRSENGNGNPPPAVSGVYRWVEKVHEIQLRHYGSRMMIEFSIPEPGLSVVGRKSTVDIEQDEPRPPGFDASHLHDGNYISYARSFEASEVAPPPERIIQVGFAWSSQPSESDNENTSEDVLSELIAIPDGYRPVGGRFAVSAHPSHESDFQVRLNIGDRSFSEDGDAQYGESFMFSPPVLQTPWPNGVPISMTAHGHFDKTISMTVMLTCRRQDRAFQQWQIDTFEKIERGFQRQKALYDEALEAAQRDRGLFNIATNQQASRLRQTEREELQKWSIKLLRRTPLAFDSTVDEGTGDGTHAEIDPVLADHQAPLVRFYEGAFEWEHMSYFLLPYFWGRRNAYNARADLTHPDFSFESFLRAGAARVIVPVMPGYEQSVIYYLANSHLQERDRIKGFPVEAEISEEDEGSIEDSIYNTLWLELLIEKNKALAVGSGFLSVESGSDQIEIVQSSWIAEARDLGRELFVLGERYEVTGINGPTEITIDRPYEGSDDPKAPYASGSVAFGPPWLTNIPTNLVVLNENIGAIKIGP